MRKNLEEIMIIYQKKKEQNEKKNEILKEEIYEKHPKYSQLEKEIAKLYLQKSIKSLMLKNNKEIASEELKKIETEIKKLEEEKEKYIKKNNIIVSELQPKYDCEKCKDTGYIIRGNRRQKCECLIQEIINMNYNISNLNTGDEERFKNYSFEYYSDIKKEGEKNSPRELAKKAYKEAKCFIEEFGHVDSKIKNIIYIGETGLRKNIFI